MLDQSFSASNFNIIFLKENRKGNIKKNFLNTEYFDKHDEFKNVLSEKIKLKKLNDGSPLTKEQLDDFAQRLDIINKEKEEIRANVFFEYSKIINSEDHPFLFNIKYDRQREVYTTKRDGLHFFVMKQLQYNIYKTFKVVQADRNNIITQVFNLLKDGFPKVVIRTDISKFYESIPQENLFELINNNTLLSPQSRKLLKKIFYEFNLIKDSSIMEAKKGIPRGLGISAYLSELYMRRIDEEIKALPDLVYYARYVDDIIAIFTPKTKSCKREYFEEMKKIVNSHDLEFNDNLEGRKEKTNIIDLILNPLNKSYYFDFLGYKIEINNNQQIQIELSKSKIEKYINRIKLSIKKYNNDSKTNEKIARKMLIDRIKFLTGNYNLNHNKRNIKAGIFYSNQMLSLNKNLNFKSLNTLDLKMKNCFCAIEPYNKIGIDKEKLIYFFKMKFSFKKGFHNKDKNFYSFKFNSKENEIYRKKFGRLSNKYEVIKSIWKDE